MRAARSENGFALVTAIVLLTVMMGLGLGLLFLTDTQRKASTREQASETSFNVAEAALSAQVGQLSRSWPGNTGLEYPTSCTAATSVATNGCPSAESLSVAYPSTGSASCPAGTPKDAWGSPLSNGWTTYVRDNGPVGAPTQLFDSTAEKSLLPYDANGDEKVFVRSVGVVQCRLVVLVALASAQYITIPFPQSAVSGNWFETTNNGKKLIINTQGSASQPGGVSMRCTGLSVAECEKYPPGKEQIVPDTTGVSPSPSPTWSASELATEKKAAESAVPSTYFKTGTCPGSLAELTGKPTYVEGPCDLSFTGGTGNSAAKPGFLILNNGTLKLNGNAEFFGTVYGVNAQASSGIIVEVHGNAQITGTAVVDGNGGLSFGSSGGQGNGNIIYNPSAVADLKTLAGASATRNSFRVLPVNQ
jgi:type II secretory pathway pseudopilin PulG